MPADNTVLVGLIGRGIGLSRTPAMHEAEGIRHGLRYVYRLLDVDEMGDPAPDLQELLRFAGHFGFCGLNVTYPYKQSVIACLDHLSESAAAVGSVNTVVIDNGRMTGHNTDMWGFKQSFQDSMSDVPLDHVVLLGAGGAGAAVAHALLQSGVGRLSLHDLDRQRADSLCHDLARQYGDRRIERVTDLTASIATADGLVNATPVGMAKCPGMPLSEGHLRPDLWIADIIYFPLETELLRKARAIGCRTLDGVGMAVMQAVRAFELFTGVAPDPAHMRATFDQLGVMHVA